MELELGVQLGGVSWEVPSAPAPQHSLLVMQVCALQTPAPVSRNALTHALNE